jgi:hypothetical protein
MRRIFRAVNPIRSAEHLASLNFRRDQLRSNEVYIIMRNGNNQIELASDSVLGTFEGPAFPLFIDCWETDRGLLIASFDLNQMIFDQVNN